MRNECIVLLLVAGVAGVAQVACAQFAGSVVSYVQGGGVAAGFTNTSAALGAPATFVGYQDADPFNPPYRSSDIVGIGTGGSMTLQLATPIVNDGTHLYGLDFIIFGHAGFNEDFDTGTATDGSLFTGGASDVQVSVSANGTTFYTLNPSLTPVVDGLYPSDAGGDPFVPVNPALTAADFAGKDLAGIRALYKGSAGGAGFDLAWAVDGSNQSVAMPVANFVRLDVLSGVAYIDAISVVPEPTIATLVLMALGLLCFRKRVL